MGDDDTSISVEVGDIGLIEMRAVAKNALALQ